MPLCELGVRNDAWAISGFGISARLGVPIPEFLGAAKGEIRETLSAYLDRFPGLSTDTGDIVMLDIEHPVHPRFLGTLLDPDDPAYDPVLFVDLVEAIKDRIEVAREVFPHARLALFATINPDARGRDDRRQFLVSFHGYLEAGRLGLYDQLDYLVPVLYQRFGPTDPAFHTIDEYTGQGIRRSRELTRSDGSPLPLFPLLAFLVFNGFSNHHREPADIARLAEQIEILRAEDVGIFGFWNGSDDLDPSRPTIVEYFQALFDPCDLEGDGDVDHRDFPSLVRCRRGPHARCSADDFLYADLDCDGNVDIADLHSFLARCRSSRR